MISSFTKFNESLVSDINKLKSDIVDVFAYISDENKVNIEIKGSEVLVDIKTILSSSITYDNVDEYIEKHERWHDVLLDINVAIEQLTTKGNIGYVFNVNTVGNVKIKFHIINNLLFNMNNNNITISTLNLLKMLNENINHIEMSTENRDRNQTMIIYFNSEKTPTNQKLFSKKIINLFSKNGLHTTSTEGIRIDIYPYNVNNMRIKFFYYKKNFTNRYKNVKIQYVV